MAKSEQFIKLTVPLGAHSYPIYIGRQLLGLGALFDNLILSKQVCIITNDTVAPLYLDRLLRHFEDIQSDVVILSDGEQYKNLDVLSDIFDTLVKKNHHRDTVLIALGGGVIGDMTGFAAACYQRGVKFVQVPTTLLAQVDASVGGKTAVNHPQGKNMIGAFHQPQAVIIDIDTLNTLPDREFVAGCAEVIKHAMIADKTFFYWLLDNVDAILRRDTDAIEYAIAKCCRIKADIVAKDEKEQSLRALLNLGHTFGHAIEVETNYHTYLHGEAVAMGLFLASNLSYELKLLSRQELYDIYRCLHAFQLPIKLPSHVSSKRCIELMMMDKKVENNILKLILVHGIGQAEIHKDVSISRIESTFESAAKFEHY